MRIRAIHSTANTLSKFAIVFITTGILAVSGCGGGSSTTKKSNGGSAPITGPVESPGLIEGGLLFDNLWEHTGNATTVDNPVWANRYADSAGAKNPRTGEDTWRCKECHGWDYLGADGAYGDGSDHFTGFPGLLDVQDRVCADQGKLADYLTHGVNDELHNFGTGEPGLTDSQIQSLVMFICDSSRGLIDTRPYIFSKNLGGAARGDSGRGDELYNGQGGCGSNSCHGPTGDLIDFDPDAGVSEYVGTIAFENPWELFHKARFGQPGFEAMTPVLTWGSVDDASDIVAFGQSGALTQ